MKIVKLLKKWLRNLIGAENTYNIQVNLNCVNSDDMKRPDLTEYDVGNSASSSIEGE